MTAGPVLGELGHRDAATSGSDRIVDPELTGLHATDEAHPLAPEGLELPLRLGALGEQLVLLRLNHLAGLRKRHLGLGQPFLDLAELVHQGQGLLLVVLERPLHHLQLRADSRLIAEVAYRQESFIEALLAFPPLFGGELQPPRPASAYLVFENQGRFLDLREERLEGANVLPGLLNLQVQLLEFLEGGSALLRHRLASFGLSSFGLRRVAEAQ